MLLLKHIAYTHPNRELLFHNIDLAIQKGEKIALIGNNGTGKSTLLRIIAGELAFSSGQLSVDATLCYVPQSYGQYNHLSIAEALGVADKLRALHQVLSGDTSDKNYQLLGDDWDIEERCRAALQYWQLEELELNRAMDTLSGGQQTKVFLARIMIHEPELVLLDEPSNHLDLAGRELLYKFIKDCRKSLIVVSHDRRLLRLLPIVAELKPDGIQLYGGSYDFYQEQKQEAAAALGDRIEHSEKALRKAREKERETAERQQRLDSRGKGKQEKAGVAKIMMNTLRNKAENSTSKLKAVHTEKISGLAGNLQALRAALSAADRMKMNFEDSSLHRGKLLIDAAGINMLYNNRPLWKEPLRMQVRSGERLVLKGANGSGKTTLLQLLAGKMKPQQGSIDRAVIETVYIDQQYSLLDNSLDVYEQTQQFNNGGLQEHELKIRLSRFLFGPGDWDKSCGALSGGERMRLILCCLGIANRSPDMMILDEPTNNLDIQNIEILTAAVKEYKGTLLLVSHDESFLEELDITSSFVI
ncbi:MAG: ABC-F family ATP-binding cassette domain-containing protein [Ferruginibacter sp.]